MKIDKLTLKLKLLVVGLEEMLISFSLYSYSFDMFIFGDRVLLHSPDRAKSRESSSLSLLRAWDYMCTTAYLVSSYSFCSPSNPLHNGTFTRIKIKQKEN